MNIKNTNIYYDITAVAEIIQYYKEIKSKVICTSGGFDPLHVGHIDCLEASKKLGNILVVIVNGDGFLIRKKGYAFLPHRERMRHIAALHCVDYVVGWDAGSQFVDGAIKILKPNIFTKGGDRSTINDISRLEIDACNQIGCELKLGVGGALKVQSSSELVERVRQIQCKKL